MLAAIYEKNGPARDVLEVREIPTPAPGPGEVRVRLKTSGVNPSDVKARRGFTRKIAYPQVIPQSDGAGEIDAVGEAVSPSRIGERVWVWNGQWQRPFGTAAQYIVLPAEQAVRLPDSVSFEAGACLGIPAMTAWQAVKLAEIGPGMNVLVAAGAGAVGHYAVQFAKMRGANVLATVSSEEKARIAREAGADHTIDYKREDVAARVRELTGGEGVHAVIEMDLTANAKYLPAILRKHGTVAIYGSTLDADIAARFLMVNSNSLRFFLIYEVSNEDRKAMIAEINDALERGRLRHNVAKVMPLAEIVAAHEAIEGGKVPGNVVLSID